MKNLRVIVVKSAWICSLVLSVFSTAWSHEHQLPPVPEGASPGLQKAISAAGAPSTRRRQVSAPTTEDEWRAAAAIMASAPGPSLSDISGQLNVTIAAQVIAGVDVYWINPMGTPKAKGLFMYLHDGAYVFGGGIKSVPEAARISAIAKIPSIAIDYRRPPDDPYPAALDDVEAVYRSLLKTHSPENIGIGGTSAGGGLSLASVHRFNDVGLPAPGALYLGTPWADLTKTGDTFYTLAGVDRILGSYEGLLENAAHLYAAGADLKNPLLSPVYGEFSGFPPAYLVTGTRDLFLSDTARVHRKLRAAGVEAELNVYEGLSHAEYLFIEGSLEHAAIYQELSIFLNRHLGSP